MFCAWLTITVNRHVLGVNAEELRTEAIDAGFADVLNVRPRRAHSPAIELQGRRPGGEVA